MLTENSDQNIRLKKDELGEYRDRPGLVELGDDSGYYATLSAYHSLHCWYDYNNKASGLTAVGIKRLHHLMYFDDYYPNKTEQESTLIKHHGRRSKHIFL